MIGLYLHYICLLLNSWGEASRHAAATCPVPQYLSSSYLPRPFSGEPSSSNSHKGLQAMTERSEEAHHVAEFHMGRGERVYVPERSWGPRFEPYRSPNTLRDTPPGLWKGLTEPLKNSSILDMQTVDEHHWACMSSVSTQNPPALQFRSNDNKYNKSPVQYAQPRGAATDIHSGSHSPVRRIQ